MKPMRIIAGKYKGKAIVLPKGIRPTQDKVREALFDILGDMEGVSFLELFAGSGAVGYEAVSRGARELTLVEYDRDCLTAIRKNIESLRPKACNFYPKEASEAIKIFHNNKSKFDIVFLDPPYYKKKFPRQPLACIGSGSGLAAVNICEPLAKKILQMLGAYDILARNGFVVVQHFKREILPKESGRLVLIKEARYGDTVLSFYKRSSLLRYRVTCL